MSFLRKVVRPPQGAVALRAASDPELAGSFPALCEHLTALVDADGSPRQTCSLTVYGVPGAFKGFLNDRDSGGAIGVEADTLQGLLEALEAALESDDPGWTFRDRAKGGRGKR